MLFLSVSFFCLFIAVFVLYYLIGDKYRNALLLAASAVFVGYASWMFLAVAAVITAFTYGAAILIERSDERRTGWLLLGSIGALVATWISFRYATSLVFPLGISFYTFQAIGYLTDVYWGESKAERNVVNFSLFMLFFMKFLSGPIERGTDLFDQLRQSRRFDYQLAVSGLLLVCLGLFKKLMIANHIAPYTADIFDSSAELDGIQLVVTCLLYPIELYADFSGYTDIAVGGARLFGIHLSPNFDRPFTATSTTDLWRRWHISLSSWVRDYVYVPLTATLRGWGQWGILASLVATFVALGIWHGAGWTFAIYGLLQGLIICWELKVKFIRQAAYKYLWKPLADGLFILRTYLLFAFSLIFFRVATMPDALHFVRNLSLDTHGSWKEANIGMPDHNWAVAGASLLCLWIFEAVAARYDLAVHYRRLPGAVRWIGYFALVFLIFLLGKFDTENFIYIQF